MTWLVVARFGKAHGLKGLVKVHSFTSPADNILNYSKWYQHSAEGWKLIDLEYVQPQGDSFLAKVKGVNDKNDVVILTNCDIAIEESSLPDLPDGEHYWHHLIGLRVETPQGKVLGVVEDLMETGSNDVLVVKGSQELLIPYLPEQFMIEVDRKKGLIVVDWDEDF